MPAGFGVWPAIVGALREWAKAEAGAGRLFPWVPVAFGCGIALYFAAEISVTRRINDIDFTTSIHH